MCCLSSALVHFMFLSYIQAFCFYSSGIENIYIKSMSFYQNRHEEVHTSSTNNIRFLYKLSILTLDIITSPCPCRDNQDGRLSESDVFLHGEKAACGTQHIYELSPICVLTSSSLLLCSRFQYMLYPLFQRCCKTPPLYGLQLMSALLRKLAM